METALSYPRGAVYRQPLFTSFPGGQRARILRSASPDFNRSHYEEVLVVRVRQMMRARAELLAELGIERTGGQAGATSPN